MKLVLSPWKVENVQQYSPQDAVYDWTVGHKFKCSEGIVSLNDVDRLWDMGYKWLVFTCPKGSKNIELPAPPMRERFDNSGLYCTEEVRYVRDKYR